MMKEYFEMEFPDPFHELTENYATFHSSGKHSLSTFQVLGRMIGPGDRGSLKRGAWPL